MNEFFNSYIETRMRNAQGNALTTSAPVNNYINKTNPLPVPAKSVLDYGNPAYNQLAVKNDAQLIAKLNENLDPEGKILLHNLLNTKKLYSRDSTDGSSTLENLYKIVNEPRVPVLNPKNILKETLKTLADPYIITQNFGKIPENMMLPGSGYENFSKGHTCSAASIEFSLADRKPAEFVRYIEGLTSPQKSVKTRLKYADLLPSMIEAVGALSQQNVEFKPIDWQNVEVTIRPDENAYLRADVQEDHRIPNSRSMIDVLMQSAFMQLGSHGTYDSLTDERSKDTGDGKGLNQFEIAFVESIVDSRSRKVPVVYMELDNDATKILKYNYDPATTKKQLLDSLNSGNNIITGFLTNLDSQNNLITPDGHEILLTGYKYDKDGKLWFKYNDTDDGNYFAPSWIEADPFIPTIHHANVPESVLGQEFKQF